MVREALTEARSSAQTVVLHEESPFDGIDDILSLLESGDEFGDAFGDAGWGDLAKVMGDPGKVRDAAIGSALRVGAKARSLLSVIVRNIHTLVIPFMKTHYDRIYARERAQMSRIQQKYPDVFKNAGELFTGDAKLAAFMINPVLMTAAVAAQGGADAVLGLTAALGASDSTIVDQVRRIWRQVNRLPQQMKPDGQQAVQKPKGFDDLYYYDEGAEGDVVLEASSVQRLAAKLLRNRQFQERLSKTKAVQAIKAEAEAVKNETLNSFIRFAQDLRQMEDIEALRRMDAELARRLERQIERTEDPGEAEAITRESIRAIKDASIKALVEKMRADIEAIKQMRVPDTSEMISAYEKAADRIESQVNTSSSSR